MASIIIKKDWSTCSNVPVIGCVVLLMYFKW
jgi:hypothetical protein